MEVAYKSYYWLNEYSLSSIGLWPYQTKFKQRLIGSIISLDIFSLLVGQTLGLCKSWGDIDTTIDCIPPYFYTLTSIVCLTACSINKQKMELLFSKIKNDWTIWTSGPEMEILCSYAGEGKKFVLIFLVFIYVSMIDFIGVPLIPPLLDILMPLNESRFKRPILVVNYFIDPDDNYYWIALHSGLTTVVLTTILFSIDSVLMIVLYHACGELAILGFVNDVCDYLSTAYFLHMAFHMVMMSVTGVQTVMHLDQPREAYTYAMFTFAQLFHLFCLSVPCQYLIDHSCQLSEDIYNGYWYRLSFESQKLLQIIMMRSSKPCTFTAGKLYTFSMESFASVVRTSMSYFTVLSSLQE